MKFNPAGMYDLAQEIEVQGYGWSLVDSRSKDGDRRFVSHLSHFLSGLPHHCASIYPLSHGMASEDYLDELSANGQEVTSGRATILANVFISARPPPNATPTCATRASALCHPICSVP